MNSSRTTADPLEALASLLQQPGALSTNLASTFYGPDATFQAAARRAAAQHNASDFQTVLKSIDGMFKETELPDEQRRAWNCLRALANLYCGAAENVRELVQQREQLLGSGNDALPPTESEQAMNRPAIDYLTEHGWQTSGDGHWTAADWRLIGLVGDLLSTEESASSRVVERTPILLANERQSRVLWLAAERLPGPPLLVSPHHWRLGLAPLGAGATSLQQQVHDAIRAVLGAQPKLPRYQIRWWLEPHSRGGGWHERLGDADSLQLSASCLAQALLERTGPTPLLDELAAASATLELAPDRPLAERRLGAVGHPSVKRDAAHDAGIVTLVFHSSLPESPGVFAAGCFGDAYEVMLANSPAIREYKRALCAAWGGPGATSGQFNEVETDQEFIDASRRNQ